MARTYDYNQKPGESIEAYYRRIAKVADQRLVRLEKLADQEGYGNADKWSYKRALSDIETWSGEGATRFNTKPPKDKRSLQAKINDIRTFLGSDTSTKSGIDVIYNKRLSTINTTYNTHFRIDDLEKVFSSSLFKKMEEKHYSSDQILQAIGYIKDNATTPKLFKALKEQASVEDAVPEFTDDPFQNQLIQEMLRDTKNVNQMYKYFKSI